MPINISLNLTNQNLQPYRLHSLSIKYRISEHFFPFLPRYTEKHWFRYLYLRSPDAPTNLTTRATDPSVSGSRDRVLKPQVTSKKLFACAKLFPKLARKYRCFVRRHANVITAGQTLFSLASSCKDQWKRVFMVDGSKLIQWAERRGCRSRWKPRCSPMNKSCGKPRLIRANMHGIGLSIQRSWPRLTLNFEPFLPSTGPFPAPVAADAPFRRGFRDRSSISA